MTLIWMCMGMTVLFGILSLAFDFGRVQLARAELQAAADAAALAAVAQLPDTDAALAAAQDVAGRNVADSSPVTLVAGNADEALNDIQFVRWQASSYTVLSGADRTAANGVRVIARRTAARGNPIALMFGGIVGLSSFDAQRAAVAVRSNIPYAVVGLDSITMTGNSTASYTSEKGHASVASQYGNVGSNGDITVSGSAYINGNAYPGPGHAVSDTAKVAGSSTPLTTDLVFPLLPLGMPTDYATVNNNAHFDNFPGIRTGPISDPSVSFSKSQTYLLPGGVYYTGDFSIGANAIVTFAGPTVLFVHGDFTMSGKTQTSGDLPRNLTVITVPHNNTPPGSISIGSGSAFYGTIYAPLSPVDLSGNGDIYGSVLGKSVSMTGSSRIIYDTSLNSYGRGVHLTK